MNKPVELIIFDWDGTLFDSVGQIVASLLFAAQQFAQPLTADAAKSIIGLGLLKSRSDYFLKCLSYILRFCNAMPSIMWRTRKVMSGSTA
jgi:hypothetical protein